jgi:hypothetical protein
MRRSALLWLGLLAAGSVRAQEVELRWSSARAVVHQQVQLAAVVVHPVGLNPRWEAPLFEGFAVERLPSESGLMRRDASGRYVRTTHLRQSLFPTRSGVLEIPASRIVFVDVGGRETSLAVPPGRLTVDALPEQGRPEGFDAAVGELSVRATLQPSAIALGEHATLELEVFGFANVWDVAAPDLEAQLGATCEVFAEAPEVDRTAREERLFARKTFRFSLVPAAAGRLAIPALRFPHFDPERGEYRVAQSDPVELDVRPAAARARAPETPPAAAQAASQDASWLAWLPTLVLALFGTGVLTALARPAPSNQASALAVSDAPPEPTAPRESVDALLRHAEASLDEPGFGAQLNRALRAALPATIDASLTPRELEAQVSDPELIALLRAIDAERFSGRSSRAQRRALLDAAAAYVRAHGDAGDACASTLSRPGR